MTDVPPVFEVVVDEQTVVAAVTDVPPVFEVVVDEQTVVAAVTDSTELVTAPVIADVVTVEAKGDPGPPGVDGRPGPPGPSDATRWWYGDGPPATVIGAKPGDLYLDSTAGTVYVLGGD